MKDEIARGAHDQFSSEVAHFTKVVVLIDEFLRVHTGTRVGGGGVAFFFCCCSPPTSLARRRLVDNSLLSILGRTSASLWFGLFGSGDRVVIIVGIFVRIIVVGCCFILTALLLLLILTIFDAHHLEAVFVKANGVFGVGFATRARLLFVGATC